VNIIPFRDMLIVKRLDRQEESKGGVLLTAGVSEKPSEGKVLAVGNKVSDSIKVNSTVLFNKFAGAIIEDNREEYLILREEDLYGERREA